MYGVAIIFALGCFGYGLYLGATNEKIKAAIESLFGKKAVHANQPETPAEQA